MKDWLESDLARYEGKMAWLEENSPECCECGEIITGDTAYLIDGDIYCEDCIDSHKIDVTQYIEDKAYEQQQREYEYAQDAKLERWSE